MDFVHCVGAFEEVAAPAAQVGKDSPIERTTDAAAALRADLRKASVLCRRLRRALREGSTSDKAELSDAK